MPTYVYQCDSCGHKFEKMQKITADPLEKCPKCGSKVERVIFGSGVIFKSDGFYTTDYANKNNQNDSSSKDNDNKKNENNKIDQSDKKVAKSNSNAE